MELFGENRLGDLEAKIEKLITSYQTMKTERETLLNRIKVLETENKEFKGKMADTKNEKEVIIDKITRILEKIEKTEL
jgi:septal ring factor EnvC (AmiA/AmiB activator)